MLVNAKKELWEKAEWFDENGVHNCLFNNMRIHPDTVPAGKYMYQVGHDHDCQGDWVQISKQITVNFGGTILTEQEIDFDSYKDGYVHVDDYSYTGETVLSDLEYDVIQIYEEDGEKKIRFLGYGYCAGSSVTENHTEIYRFVEFSDETYLLTDALCQTHGIKGFCKVVSETAKQTIKDLTEEELKEVYFEKTKKILTHGEVTMDTTCDTYLLYLD